MIVIEVIVIEVLTRGACSKSEEGKVNDDKDAVRRRGRYEAEIDINTCLGNYDNYFTCH